VYKEGREVLEILRKLRPRPGCPDPVQHLVVPGAVHRVLRHAQPVADESVRVRVEHQGGQQVRHLLGQFPIFTLCFVAVAAAAATAATSAAASLRQQSRPRQRAPLRPRTAGCRRLLLHAGVERRFVGEPVQLGEAEAGGGIVQPPGRPVRPRQAAAPWRGAEVGGRSSCLRVIKRAVSSSGAAFGRQSGDGRLTGRARAGREENLRRGQQRPVSQELGGPLRLVGQPELGHARHVGNAGQSFVSPNRLRVRRISDLAERQHGERVEAQAAQQAADAAQQGELLHSVQIDKATRGARVARFVGLANWRQCRPRLRPRMLSVRLAGSAGQSGPQPASDLTQGAGAVAAGDVRQALQAVQHGQRGGRRGRRLGGGGRGFECGDAGTVADINCRISSSVAFTPLNRSFGLTMSIIFLDPLLRLRTSGREDCAAERSRCCHSEFCDFRFGSYEQAHVSSKKFLSLLPKALQQLLGNSSPTILLCIIQVLVGRAFRAADATKRVVRCAISLLTAASAVLALPYLRGLRHCSDCLVPGDGLAALADAQVTGGPQGGQEAVGGQRGRPVVALWARPDEVLRLTHRHQDHEEHQRHHQLDGGLCLRGEAPCAHTLAEQAGGAGSSSNLRGQLKRLQAVAQQHLAAPAQGSAQGRSSSAGHQSVGRQAIRVVHAQRVAQQRSVKRASKARSHVSDSGTASMPYSRIGSTAARNRRTFRCAARQAWFLLSETIASGLIARAPRYRKSSHTAMRSPLGSVRVGAVFVPTCSASVLRAFTSSPTREDLPRVRVSQVGPERVRWRRPELLPMQIKVACHQAVIRLNAVGADVEAIVSAHPGPQSPGPAHPRILRSYHYPAPRVAAQQRHSQLVPGDSSGEFLQAKESELTPPRTRTLGQRQTSLQFKVPFGVIYSLILMLGVSGNLCTCVVIARTKCLHTVTNLYLFSLAVSDLSLLLTGSRGSSCERCWLTWAAAGSDLPLQDNGVAGSASRLRLCTGCERFTPPSKEANFLAIARLSHTCDTNRGGGSRNKREAAPLRISGLASGAAKHPVGKSRIAAGGVPHELYSILVAQYPWYLGSELCRLRSFLAELTPTVSILTITCFTVERYIAIAHPLRAQVISSFKRTLFIILSLWLLGGLVCVPVGLASAPVPYVVYPNLSESRYAALGCPEPPWANLTGQPIPLSVVCNCAQCDTHIQVSGLLFFVVPVCVIAVLYLLIAVALRRSNPMSSRGSRGADAGASGARDNRRDRDRRSKNSVVRMLAGHSHRDQSRWGRAPPLEPHDAQPAGPPICHRLASLPARCPAGVLAQRQTGASPSGARRHCEFRSGGDNSPLIAESALPAALLGWAAVLFLAGQRTREQWRPNKRGDTAGEQWGTRAGLPVRRLLPDGAGRGGRATSGRAADGLNLCRFSAYPGHFAALRSGCEMAEGHEVLRLAPGIILRFENFVIALFLCLVLPPQTAGMENPSKCFQLVIVVTFFICWAPFHLQRLLATYGRLQYLPAPITNALYFCSGEQGCEVLVGETMRGRLSAPWGPRKPRRRPPC
uniref:G_PROTEIN_RECEP_F1_2 domain-containing protein n=1 Tax=Macrostomum lignano TaxID=282301 RepID=A0A1I8H1H4_9PLAT